MKFIELTQAYKCGYAEKFCLNTESILYFSAFQLSTANSNYENCNSIIETLSGSGGNNSQACYVQETYEQIKEMLNA